MALEENVSDLGLLGFRVRPHAFGVEGASCLRQRGTTVPKESLKSVDP